MFILELNEDTVYIQETLKRSSVEKFY